MRRLIPSSLLLAVALGVWFGLPWVKQTFFAGNFDFAALEQPAGFRQLAGGEVSGGVDPVTGLLGAGAEDSGGNQNELAVAIGPENLCHALFGDMGAGDAADSAVIGASGDGIAENNGAAENIVPIAYFSDYRCPYCRVLSKRLEALAATRDDVRIIWHEWPIFGEVSERAARAALAAKRQGAHAAFHHRLMRSSFVPTEGYLRTLAEQSGIDADALLAEMESPRTEHELAETAALAGMFGFRGTPALVIGRTALVGAVDDARLGALIDRELKDGPIEACGSAEAVK